MAFPQGATFVFSSWVCIANDSGGFYSHLANPIEPEAISSENRNTITGSDAHGDMLLPDLAQEIEQKVDINSSSTRTQIDLDSSSTRIGTLYAQPIFGFRNSSSAYQWMIKSIYSSYGAGLDQTMHVENSFVIASREAPRSDHGG